MGNKKSIRREVTLTCLQDVADECQSLLTNGYTKNGNWTLGQICHHLRGVQEKTIDGFPVWMSFFAPIRPVLRWLVLPRLLRGQSPAGVPTAPMFVPPNDLDDRKEVDLYCKSVQRFLDHEGPFKPHPGFGRLEKPKLESFHSAHASHHLGFLEPTTASS